MTRPAWRTITKPGTRRRIRAAVTSGLLLLSAGGSSPGARAEDREQNFIAENNAAMSRMMSGMTIAATGDIDRDFVAMMMPHHLGAIDMAEAELRYGHNEQLHRIAQEIVVTQRQEIRAMRLAIGGAATASARLPVTPICTAKP